MNPTDRMYSQDHEWVKLDDGVATVGITDYAQDQLTDIVFVELPEVGKVVKQGENLAVLESVKSVADVFAPVSGEVVEVNTELEAHPEKVNESAFEEGWIVKLKTQAAGTSHLMDAAAYDKFVAEQDH